jgi:hypothetical protein
VGEAEERLVRLLRHELLSQQHLDKGAAATGQEPDLPEGLQTMSVADLEVIEHFYKNDESLKEVSKRTKEIHKLIQQAKHWDKPEKERKWFHI